MPVRLSLPICLNCLQAMLVLRKVKAALQALARDNPKDGDKETKNRHSDHNQDSVRRRLSVRRHSGIHHLNNLSLSRLVKSRARKSVQGLTGTTVVSLISLSKICDGGRNEFRDPLPEYPTIELQ
jgi:hypothetical protein